MPKYWGKQIFSLMSFPEVGQKQKTEKKERPKVANNNGQLHIETPPLVAHASHLGQQVGSMLFLPEPTFNSLESVCPSYTTAHH